MQQGIGVSVTEDASRGRGERSHFEPKECGQVLEKGRMCLFYSSQSDILARFGTLTHTDKK